VQKVRKSHKQKLLNKVQQEEIKAIALSNEKDCYYLKADNGNAVVIMKKPVYIARVENNGIENFHSPQE
jgi:hypothetical protein